MVVSRICYFIVKQRHKKHQNDASFNRDGGCKCRVFKGKNEIIKALAPKSDPRDSIVYPIGKLMIDSYMSHVM